MALTFNELGKEFLSEKRIVEIESDNVNIESLNVRIYDKDDNILWEGNFLPEIGTSDTFRVELNSIIREVYDFSFYDLTTLVAILGDFNFVQVDAAEIETDGTVNPYSTKQGYVCHNFTVEEFLVNDFDPDDYNCGNGGSSASLLATSAPRTQELKEGDSAFVGVNQISRDVGGAQQELRVEKYDENDSLISASSIAFDDTNTFTSGIYANAFRIEMDSSAYIICFVRDNYGANTIRSEVMRYNNVDTCRPVRIHWQNEFGQQDSFYFKGEYQKTLSSNSKMFERAKPVNRNTQDYGRRQYGNIYGDVWRVYTDTISQDLKEWLKGMYKTKKVAVEIDGNYYPATLNNSSLNYYNDINGVYQIEIPITFANSVVGNN